MKRFIPKFRELGSEYKNIFIITGGFHQLLICQNIFKQHRYLGYKECFIDSMPFVLSKKHLAFIIIKDGWEC